MNDEVISEEELQEDAIADGSFAGVPIFFKDILAIINKNDASCHINQFLALKNWTLPNSTWKLINSWRNYKRNHEVQIWHNKTTNKVKKHLICLKFKKHSLIITTLSIVNAWNVEAELKAQTLLKELITENQWKQYTFFSSFKEISKKSGLLYIFRKCRPTVVYKMNKQLAVDYPFTALCYHPLGYYYNTWSGVHCPTDDVIAHLLMMRGDEHGYWKKSVQHDLRDPEVGY